MEQNDLNSEERIISPLRHDMSGRFSRKGKPVKEKKDHSKLNESLYIALFMFCIILADIVLFAYSRDIPLFMENGMLIKPFLIIAGISLSASLILSLVLFNFRVIRSILVAVFVSFFIFVFFKQFAMFTQDITVGDNIIPLSALFGVSGGVLTYAVLAQNNVLYKLLLLVSSVILLLHIASAYIFCYNKISDYIEVRNYQPNGKGKGKRFVYVFLPNLSSYQYMSSIRTPYAINTQQIMQGFFQKNNFTVYSRAYNKDVDYIQTVVRMLNPSTKNGLKGHLMNTKLIKDYWKFRNLRDDFIYLKDNELYDYLQAKGYTVSAYKSKDIDLCSKKHKDSVARCVEKTTKAFNVNNQLLTLQQNLRIFAIQWLMGSHLFKDYNSLLKMFAEYLPISDLPIIGTNYNNVYTLNSVDVFDILLEDMKKDSGKQAYFVLTDTPSNIFVYDEYCRVKPLDKWLNISQINWLSNPQDGSLQKAYLQQTRCLFGKLEDFISKLRQNDLWNNTSIIIQGVSSVNDFEIEHTNNVKVSFVNEHLTTMAIHNEGMKNNKVDDGICPTNVILSDYLFGTHKCKDEKLNFNEVVVKDIVARINRYSQGFSDNYIKKFENWYKKWQERNNISEVITNDDMGIDL